MTDPTWAPLRAVVAIQRELIAEHGGLTGPPRHGDLEAALGRPINLHAYSQTPLPLPRLAAAYGFALARGHCFPDGNKRVALAIIDVFLRMNGLQLTADELDAVDTIQSLAAGDLTEDQLADWITAHVAPIARIQRAPPASESP
ncbi:MAG: type II toxin-antitoxin system death-on-curing family toxin [Steroidobacteraceae bacterium]|nr:type II toxin-antitoxin system death-on-curing family toxin [Pseudomonadota bacterium]MBP6108094.1 type II toxin-antitoxin system death-on-curing family toxin [Steroidobacteraceae bacterium]MBP7015395.1 type II toxin-antitoxin system death-on-curing family toxin [Steroidobacteraceae bacterium]